MEKRKENVVEEENKKIEPKTQEKKKKVQAIADILQNLLQQVDIFTQVLTKEDFEILEEARSELESKISYKQSAMPLLFAIGADPDTTEDEMKLKTINLLIELIKARIEYKEEMLKLQEKNQRNQETMNLFKNMGIL